MDYAQTYGEILSSGRAFVAKFPLELQAGVLLIKSKRKKTEQLEQFSYILPYMSGILQCMKFMMRS